MAGSSHSYHRALHCLALLRTSSEEMRAHWFSPYLHGRGSVQAGSEEGRLLCRLCLATLIQRQQQQSNRAACDAAELTSSRRP